MGAHCDIDIAGSFMGGSDQHRPFCGSFRNPTSGVCVLDTDYRCGSADLGKSCSPETVPFVPETFAVLPGCRGSQLRVAHGKYVLVP